MRQLCGHYPELAQQKFSSNVVEKCLKLGGQSLAEMRERVIRELLNSPLMPRLLQVHPFPPLFLHACKLFIVIAAHLILTKRAALRYISLLSS